MLGRLCAALSKAKVDWVGSGLVSADGGSVKGLV